MLNRVVAEPLVSQHCLSLRLLLTRQKSILHHPVSLRIGEANISFLHHEATKRIELLEKQLQERRTDTAEIKVQKAVAIEDRTLSEETDDVLNVSTPSSIQRSIDEEFGYDDTYDDGELRVEGSASISPAPEATVNDHRNRAEEYCEFCLDYGHDTFSCASYLVRRQCQNQTRPK
ncbi:hypothetical protein GCK32_005678 [Trichostrongylus colubriformis]|uniref:Uncharacterized protein n=1 Tax=Trichostrongylus colubriformis TaxID=6319 RepID=A0AAN8FMH8_TRICO